MNWTSILPKLLASLKAAEGWSSTIYLDTTGNITIGYGFNLGKLVLPPGVTARIIPVGGISQVVGESLLVGKAMEAINKIKEVLPVFDLLDAIRQEVIADMAYNMGPGFLTRGSEKAWPKFIAQIEARDYEAAASNMKSTRWYRQVRRRSPRLVEMMRTGKDPGMLDTPPPKRLYWKERRGKKRRHR